MQISMNANYPGYVLNAIYANVKFNGELIFNCIAADEEAGICVVYGQVNGNFVVENDYTVIEILNGKVEIILPEGWEPILPSDWEEVPDEKRALS